MRVRQPDASGYVRRGDVAVWWERFGSCEPALLFFGGDTIVHSHMWKAQVPWFARRHTVVVFDPVGNGRSSRPADPAAYADSAVIADALAVLDAADVPRAFLVGVCSGAGLSLQLAAEHPDRVIGIVAINPGIVVTAPHPHRRPGGFDTALDTDDGWAKENAHYWRRDWPGYVDFFFEQLLPEPHSSKQHEDAVGWACETTADIMLSEVAKVLTGAPGPRFDPESAAAICRQVRCPVLVINGDRDMCQPPERSHRVAELTGGELVVIEGAGHLPHARDPVRVNLEIDAFLARCGARREPVAELV